MVMQINSHDDQSKILSLINLVFDASLLDFFSKSFLSAFESMTNSSQTEMRYICLNNRYGTARNQWTVTI